MQQMTTKKLALCGLFLAMALITSYIERMLPLNPGIPGVKLGLSNIVTMILLYIVGTGTALVVTLLRILLAGLMFGSGFSMVYSTAGAICSMLIMMILKRTRMFSAVGVSVAGGVFHNIGQILVAVLVLETGSLIYYLPILIVSGLGAGIVVGMLSGILIKRLEMPIRQMLE